MKLTLLFLSILILFSSCSSLIHNYTYIPLQPNEPAFTERTPIKITGANGVSHTELQIATSPVKYLSLTGSSFFGYMGQWAYNYGAGGYYKILSLKNVDFYTSLSFSRGEGNIAFSRRYSPFLGGTSTNIFNTYYTNNIRNLSVYFIDNREGYEKKYGFILSKTHTQFTNLFHHFDWIYSQNSSNNTSRTLDRENITFRGYGVYFFCHYGKIGKRFYAQIIGGLQPTSKVSDQLFDDLYSKNKNRFAFDRTLTLSFAIGWKLN
jgi:hypothetical protein